MPKSVGMALMVMNFILAVCVGFLAWQTNEIREETARELSGIRNTLSSTASYANSISTLQSELKEQKEALSTLSASVATLTLDTPIAEEIRTDSPPENSDSTVLGLTSAEFQAAAQKIHTGLQAVPNMQEGKSVGVRLVAVDATNLLSALGLHTGDVITFVDEKEATLSGFEALFQNNHWPLTLDYLRDGKQISASFLASDAKASD